MNIRHLFAFLALLYAAAIYSLGCDNQDSVVARSGTHASDDVADATREGGLIPEDQLRQSKQMWAVRISELEQQIDMLQKVNQQYKDEALAMLIEQIRPKLAAMRTTSEAATASDWKVLSFELPRQSQEIAIEVAQAIERMQEQGLAAAGSPTGG